jgi:general transcription factor 3C polypeptide 3 (transcription factor C subunit 4)
MSCVALTFSAEDNATQAIYCYRRAIKLDGSSPDLIWKLVEVYRQTEQYNKAVDALRKIHRVEPSFLRDFNMLMEVHPIIMQTTQYAFGATAFGEAFTYHFATFEKPEDQEADNTMTIEHIVIYVDYLLKSGDPESAVGVIHRGQRWLQRRKNEKGWDAMDDDSEYFPKDDEDEQEAGSGGYDLDNQLRYRLAVARLRLGQDDEALVRTQVELC